MLNISYNIVDDTEVDGNRSEKVITQVKIEDADNETLMSVIDELHASYDEVNVSIRLK